LLLLLPTLIGITVIEFAITRFVPGGPLDQAKAEAQRAALESGTRSEGSQGALSPDQMKQLEKHYGFDKPVLQAYATWLGAWPRETDEQSALITPETPTATLALPSKAGAGGEAPSTVPATVQLQDDGSPRLLDESGQAIAGWHTRAEVPEDTPDVTRVVVFRRKCSGILQGDMGTSYLHNKPVWSIIRERFPISVYFGVITLIVTYCTCIPLGILKAMRHRQLADNLTSVLIFVGYAIPGYVLATILLYFFAFELHWFADSGFVSEGFASFTLGQKAGDLFRHTFLPLCCYLVGSFAVMTMLMKNQLMDNLSADYVRTAVAKGVSFRRAVIRHAFRNSLVPIATGFGQVVSLVLMGSFLIEKIFDINGFGLLGFTSIVERDYPVVMGILLIGAFLMLLGNIISDICVAWADPRIRFGK